MRTTFLVSRVLLILGAALVLLTAVARPAGAERTTAAAPIVRYRPPVIAPITDHFRPPDGPYGAGNRGIDYATVPGTPVGASAAGRVTFAGQVGGRLVVVLVHADGLKSTYDDLATLAVAVGVDVLQGETLGTASAHLHFGVRDGTAYLDPELLFAATVAAPDIAVVARLVPTDGGAANAGRGAGGGAGPAKRR